MKLVDKNSKLKSITTFVVCLSPVLCIYRVLGVFMLGEVFLIVLLFANLRTTINVNRLVSYKQRAILWFAFGIISISCCGFLINGVELAVLPRLIRLLFCLIVAALFGGCFFDYVSAQKYIIFIAVVATALLIFQKLYHDTTGEYIYFLSKENIYSSVYNSLYFLNVEMLATYRPMSIFLEPSHYCQYISFALAIVLFKSKASVKDILTAVFLSLGIVVSASSIGAVLGLALWAIYFFTIAKAGIINSRVKLKVLFIIALVVVAAIAIFAQIGDRFLFAIQRIYNPSGSSSTVAWDSRLGTFSIFFEHVQPTVLLFGRGYGVINESEWYASIPYYYSGTGLLGMLLIIFFVVSMYRLSNQLQRKLLFVFCVLCFTTEVLANYWLIFILPLIMTATEDKGMERQ